MALATTIENKMSIKDGSDTVASLNKSENNTTFTNYTRNKEYLAPSATAIPLDYGMLNNPKYLKIVSDLEITITIGAEVFLAVTSFERRGTIKDLTMTNPSATATATVDYVACE